MKQVLSLLLTVFLTVSLLTVSAAAEAPESIYFSKTVTIKVNGAETSEAKVGTNVFSAEITNPGEDTNVTLYAAAYSTENGVKKLLDLDLDSQPVNTGKSKEFTATLNVTEEADEIRFFAFCNNGLEPIVAAVGVEFFGTEKDNVTVYKINHF